MNLIYRKGEINMSKYEEIKKYSQEAFQFMENFRAEDYADGRYDLKEEGLFVNIMTFTTKKREEQKYEAHKKYIDVQWVLDGEEAFCLKDISDMEEKDIIMPYNEEQDIMFYSQEVEGEYHILKSGEFLVMPPECAHMPGMEVQYPSVVRKAVIKIPVK